MASFCRFVGQKTSTLQAENGELFKQDVRFRIVGNISTLSSHLCFEINTKRHLLLAKATNYFAEMCVIG